MRRLYLAGKVSNCIYEEVWNQFSQAEEQFSGEWAIVNPLRIVAKGTEWNEAMRICIKNLVECDAICLLPGWAESRGARLEYEIAERLGFEILIFD